MMIDDPTLCFFDTCCCRGCLDCHVVMTPTHEDLRFACLNQVVWNRYFRNANVNKKRCLLLQGVSGPPRGDDANTRNFEICLSQLGRLEPLPSVTPT
jgi:hypothetical protein